MEYIIENFTAEGEDTFLIRAARVSGLKLMSIHNGGLTHVYSDIGLNKIQREFKKMVNFLINSYLEDGLNSNYRYTEKDIKDTNDFISKIKPNSKKTPK